MLEEIDGKSLRFRPEASYELALARFFEQLAEFNKVWRGPMRSSLAASIRLVNRIPKS